MFLTFNKQRISIILLIFVSLIGKSQDPEFSQIYPGLLKLNPAFAGTGGQGRISGIYRNQWPGLGSAFGAASFFAVALILEYLLRYSGKSFSVSPVEHPPTI